MTKCYQCEQDFDVKELEDWGTFFLCKTCSKKVRQRVKPNQETPNMRVVSGLGKEATFIHDTNTIKLGRFISDERLLTVLNHEFMHHALGYVISLRTSCQYDNVSGYGQLDEFIL